MCQSRIRVGRLIWICTDSINQMHIKLNINELGLDHEQSFFRIKK